MKTRTTIIEFSPDKNNLFITPCISKKHNGRENGFQKQGGQSAKDFLPKPTRMTGVTIKITIPSSNGTLIPRIFEDDTCRFRIETNVDVIKYSAYAAEIYTYLKDEESKYDIPKDYLKGKHPCFVTIRNFIADWLIKAHSVFQLRLDIYFLAVSIFDRYIVIRDLSLQGFRILGVTALFIATKYAGNRKPKRKPFGVSTGQFKMNDVIDMEWKVLKALDFKLSFPLPVVFFRLLSKVSGANAKERNVAKYIMELCTCTHELATCRPSLLAASAMYLTLRVFRPGFVWSQSLILASEYHVPDLLPVTSIMVDHMLTSNSSKLTAARQKYSVDKFHNVSLLPELNSKLIGAYLANI